MAAQTLHAALNSLDPQTLQACLAHIPELSELESAFAKAEDSDGPLKGVPYLLKDLFDVKGLPTRAGSVFLENERAVPEQHSRIYKDLKRSGAVYAGKSQLNPFAYGLSGENPHYGDCPHPTVPQRLAGGSSSGSAWAVGRGLVPLAIGTDTAGSIRVPAAFCGVYGLRLPMRKWLDNGCFPLAPSFDTVGWFTMTAEDMLEANQALLGEAQPRSSEPLRVLDLMDYVGKVSEELESDYYDYCRLLNSQYDPETAAWLGFNYVGCELAYSVLSSYEAYQVHAEWLDKHQSLYDPVVWQRLDRGRQWSENERYLAGIKRDGLVRAFHDVFQRFDVVLVPTTPVPSPKKRDMNGTFRSQLLQMNTPASLARLPVLNIPMRLPNGTSGGMQAIFPSMERLRVAELLAIVSGQDGASS